MRSWLLRSRRIHSRHETPYEAVMRLQILVQLIIRSQVLWKFKRLHYRGAVRRLNHSPFIARYACIGMIS